MPKKKKSEPISLRRLYLVLSTLTMVALLVVFFFTHTLLDGIKTTSNTFEWSNHFTATLYEIGGISQQLDPREMIQKSKSTNPPSANETNKLVSLAISKVQHLQAKVGLAEDQEFIRETQDPLTRISKRLKTIKKRWESYFSNTAANKSQLSEISKEIAFLKDEISTVQYLGHSWLQANASQKLRELDGMSTLEYRLAALSIFLIILISLYSQKVMKAENLIKNQRMQMVNSARLSALGGMAGGMAHEINNPLGFIVGYSEQVAHLLSKEPVDMDQVKQKLERIDASVERIQKIIRGLKTFARDGEEDPMEPAPFGRIMEDTLALCEQKLKKDDVQLIVRDYPKDLVLQCREVQVSQVLLNLIGNAHHEVESLKEKWVKLDFVVSKEKLEIHVIDSGKGIPANIREKILEPFFTTKAVGVGTGMGLSISKGIIEAHNGKFWIDGKHPNTKFVMELPLVEGLQPNKNLSPDHKKAA